MRVLAGLNAADPVRLTVDGIVHVAPRDLAALAPLIPQDAQVFEGSVLENLTFGAAYPPDAVTHKVRISASRRCSRRCRRGSKRLIAEPASICRAGSGSASRSRVASLQRVKASSFFLGRAHQQPGSADRARVFAELRSAMPHACVVAAVHRLNLLPDIDRVVLMDAGAVLDTGRVDELLERQPLFRECGSAR